MAFKKVYTNDFEAQKLQDNVAGEFQRINSTPFQSGIFVRGIDLSTSDVKVEHKLGRTPLGYIVTERSAGETVYKSTTANTKPELFIILKATGAVTVDLYVF